MRTREETRLAAREALWKKIKAMREFYVTDLMPGLRLDISTVGLYARSLVKAGILEVAETTQAAGGPRPRYRLVRDSDEPPRVRKDGTPVTQGRGRKNLWRSMRILPTFDLAMLVQSSDVVKYPVSWSEAETYLRYLEKAGYVRRLNNKSLATASFRLIRYTGPKPPMITRNRDVYDPNLKKVVWKRGEVRGDR